MDQTILVVENAPLVRTRIRVTLEGQGFTVLEARDGRTALETVRACVPDLVLQNLRLPDMDGFDFPAALHGLAGAASTPIVAISGTYSWHDMDRWSDRFAELVFLPIEEDLLLDAVRKALPESEPDYEPLGRGRSVLLVDDSPVMRTLMAARLEGHGFVVTTATDGQEGLERAREAPPDAVVSDVMMPRLDGFQLCRALRTDEALAAIPVVLMSAVYVEDADSDLAIKAGASAYVNRMPDFEPVVDALVAALTEQDFGVGPDAQLDAAAHRDRLAMQLQRQAELNSELATSTGRLEARLSALAAAAQVFEGTPDISEALQRMLERHLDANAYLLGAVFLSGGDGQLELAASVAADPKHSAHLAEFYGYQELLLAALGEHDVLTLPSARVKSTVSGMLLGAAAASSIILAPLRHGARPLGVFVMAVGEERHSAGAISFAKAVQSQVSLAIGQASLLDDLRSMEQRFRELSTWIPEGIVLTDQADRITFLNPTAQRLMSCSWTAAVGESLDALVRRESEAGSWTGQSGSADEPRALAGKTTCLRDPSGQPYRIHLIRSATPDRSLDEELLALASQDPLTGLLNRRAFETRVDRATRLAARHGVRGALVRLDVTSVRNVVGQRGIAAGDKALLEITRLIEERLRETDSVARLSGDELGVLCPATGHGEADALVTDLRRVVAGATTVDEGAPPHVAVGVAIFPDDGGDAATILEKAQAAMA